MVLAVGLPEGNYDGVDDLSCKRNRARQLDKLAMCRQGTLAFSYIKVFAIVEKPIASQNRPL